jgi:hypothetical protein
MSSYLKAILAFLVFLMVFQSVVISVADLKRPYWGDEDHFVPTIRQFGDGLSLNTLKHYNELSTPLPFIVYALWGRIFGFETHVLRLLSVIIALTTYLLFHRLLWVVFHNPRIAFLAGAFLAVHPYMVGFSIFVFTDMLPILFLILAAMALIRRSATGFGLAAAGALLCRQYYVFLPLAAGMFSLLAYKCESRTEEPDPKRWGTLSMLLASVLSIAPLGMLFIFWQGFSPDNARRILYLQEGLSFHPSFFILYVCLLFIYLIPIVVVNWRNFYTSYRILIVCFVLSWVYWLFPVGSARYEIGIDVHIVGLFHHFLHWINPGGFFEQVVFFIAFLLGLPILLFLVKDCYLRVRDRKCDFALFLDMSILAFLVIMPFSYLCWEKYFMPLVPLVTIRTLLTGYKCGDATKCGNATTINAW